MRADSKKNEVTFQFCDTFFTSWHPLDVEGSSSKLWINGKSYNSQLRLNAVVIPVLPAATAGGCVGG